MITSQERTWAGTDTAAAQLQVNPETLRRWRRSGQLQQDVHWRHSPVGNQAFVQWSISAIRELMAG